MPKTGRTLEPALPDDSLPSWMLPVAFDACASTGAHPRVLPDSPLTARPAFSAIQEAGDGNRTHVASLEGWGSTIELRPQKQHVPLSAQPAE